jgi:hypothetical protein
LLRSSSTIANRICSDARFALFGLLGKLQGELMRSRKSFIPALVFTAVAAAGIGFGASHVRDNRAIKTLAAERDLARDCRHSGVSLSPCPVVYRNTRLEWRDRIETVQTPDRRQAERIASLSVELARVRRTVRDLERRRMWPPRMAAYGWQNGTMQHPYSTDERCPAGSVVVYDSAGGLGNRHSGDPSVCYVLTNWHRLALSSPRR